MKDWPSHKTFCQDKRKELEHSSKESKQFSLDAENKTSIVSETDPRSVDVILSKATKDKHGEDNSDEDEDVNARKDKNRNGIPFDTRPYLPVKPISMATSSCHYTIAKIAVKNLISNGYCVMDGVFSGRAIDKALRDFHKFDEIGRFESGKLAGGRTSGEDDKKVVNAGIRSDKIVWVEGDEADTPGVRDVMTKLDNILIEFNGLLKGKYNITNRTKVGPW